MTSNPSPLSPDLIQRFAAIVGPAHALTDAALIEPFVHEPRDRFTGHTNLVLRPGSRDEVSAIMRLASDTRMAVVPQGGNTGLVGGQQPLSANEVILSLSRLNHILDVDPVGRTMVVEAGVVLSRIQDEAERHGCLFPLSLGSEGSCQIGGNLSSNAGGIGVLAYGNARELCLGLEAVLPSGEVFHGLKRLRKDNRGYDLKDLLIGSEGTLAIITAAVLKLYPAPAARELAYVGVDSPEKALRLFQDAQKRAAGELTAFELLPRIGMEFSLKHGVGLRDPLSSPHPWYVLIEITSGHSADDASSTLEEILGHALEEDLIRDAVIAQSLSDAAMFRRIREDMSWAQKPEGGSIKHDIAVPVARVPEFLRRADPAVLEAIPGARIVAFGHLGDGNIHYNISQPVGADREAYLARWEEINAIVHGIVRDMGGTFSAEHGIGQLKREELARTAGHVEIDLMKRIKAVFDPYNILNPGKVI
ncbi:FAD-binding oxidoreductase [Consotaella salsifontis]|uniref:4-phosphoerythronate dehydrogenase (FAD-dependent) n=1 Tax=Consotaella salsifontis TaxID=1365950 RepID=A0A1T4N0B1_9HYPH|nr:FAD-binding oxidoreductase [Consotaella salsifontis]SJZ72328.1 4-phosphoerythronate dehydrogenase (FAD-dependent) [Consotaella salsifontis]